jgi:hypothetical protein
LTVFREPFPKLAWILGKVLITLFSGIINKAGNKKIYEGVIE